MSKANMITADQDFGRANVALVSEMLESFALVPFNRIPDMTPARHRQMVQDAQRELSTPGARIYNRL